MSELPKLLEIASQLETTAVDNPDTLEIPADLAREQVKEIAIMLASNNSFYHHFVPGSRLWELLYDRLFPNITPPESYSKFNIIHGLFLFRTAGNIASNPEKEGIYDNEYRRCLEDSAKSGYFPAWYQLLRHHRKQAKRTDSALIRQQHLNDIIETSADTYKFGVTGLFFQTEIRRKFAKIFHAHGEKKIAFSLEKTQIQQLKKIQKHLHALETPRFFKLYFPRTEDLMVDSETIQQFIKEPSVNPLK